MMKPAAAVLVVLLLMGAGAYAYDRAVTEPLRQQLRSSLVDRKLLEQIAAAVAAGRPPTAAAPLPITVNLQGRPQDIRVFLEQPKLPPPEPGKPADPALPPRVVVEAPPVYCKTKAECDRLYALAPQAIRINAQVNPGTLAWVCLEPLAGGRCAAGKEASLPLSRPLTFALEAVQSERGVFHGLNVEGAPVTITQVRTETRAEIAVGPRPLPFNIGAFIRTDVLSGLTFAGLRYTNRLGSFLYEVEPAFGYDPRLPEEKRIVRALMFGLVLPIR